MSDQSVPAPTVTIRPAATIDDYLACQEAQRRAWGIADEAYVVPIATMVGAQLHGGLVLGAFLDDGSAIGLSFAFLGRIEGRLVLYSQLTGVVPGYQGGGVGGRLKQAQWQYARDEGLELLAWAFDPLQAGNAHFNLARLGARSHTYVENMYGLRTDALNAGVPTDRLIVHWSTAPASQPRIPLDATVVGQLPRVVAGVARADGLLDVSTTNVPPDASSMLLEIPVDIGPIRSGAPELAEGWRSAVAHAFSRLFADGFEAVDFFRSQADTGRRAFYVLRRR